MTLLFPTVKSAAASITSIAAYKLAFPQQTQAKKQHVRIPNTTARVIAPLASLFNSVS